MLQSVLVPVLVVTGAGLVAGLLLSIASKFFAVEVDETVAKLRENLPGANCGPAAVPAVMNMRQKWQQERQNRTCAR